MLKVQWENGGVWGEVREHGFGVMRLSRNKCLPQGGLVDTGVLRRFRVVAAENQRNVEHAK